MVRETVTPDYQTEERMAAKRRAIPLPDLHGKQVLDVGCDMGYWSFLSADLGASIVVGLDRGRLVRGEGFVDLAELNNSKLKPGCRFYRFDLGRQWRFLGQYDVIYLFSLYHHIYQNTGGDHRPIWHWLAEHLTWDGVLLWENPTGLDDPVARHDIAPEFHAGYNRDRILEAASIYFDAEFIGPALHEPSRWVYRLKRKSVERSIYDGRIVSGAGGATKAFEYASGRRMNQIEHILGWRPYPGSLNIQLEQSFDWNRHYYRAEVLDVVDRSKGLDSEWKPRWARFYPVTVNHVAAVAFRFEGESYPENFVELISNVRLRDMLNSERVALQCPL